MAATVAHGPPAITVDVEDWSQSSWDRALPIGARSADNARRMLDLLDRSGVRATLFVLGKFAEAYPELVRTMHKAGHEIASHGYGHLEIFHQSRTELTEDVRRSKDLLEQILGERVRGYRAPDFSIVERTLWALPILDELGFEYDSSIFPIAHRRYGIADWPRSPVRVNLGNGRHIVELPIATWQAWGRNWPVGGGGYHRLLPGFVARTIASDVMTESPFVFYCHPYELDPGEFRSLAFRVPMKTRLHQGLGRSRFGKRMTRFVSRFGGRTAVELARHTQWPPYSRSDSLTQ